MKLQSLQVIKQFSSPLKLLSHWSKFVLKFDKYSEVVFFSLTFTYVSGFNLTSAVVDNLKVSAGSNSFFTSDVTATGSAINVIPAGIRAYKGYSYGCSATPALLFASKDNTDILLGIILNNVQVHWICQFTFLTHANFRSKLTVLTSIQMFLVPFLILVDL